MSAKKCERSDSESEEFESKEYAKAEEKGFKEEKDSQNDIVEIVKRYFFEDEEFSRTFEDFADDYCDIFQLHDEELKLEYTNLHQKFISLFEDKISAHLKENGYEVSEFYEAIRESYKENRENDIFFSQILVATTDFEIFLQLMRETKAQKLREASNKEAK